MSGFLDRLAARAVGEAGALRPRLPARFEPGTPALPGGPPAGGGDEGSAPPYDGAERAQPAARTFEPAPAVGRESAFPAEAASPPSPTAPLSPRRAAGGEPKSASPSARRAEAGLGPAVERGDGRPDRQAAGPRPATAAPPASAALDGEAAAGFPPAAPLRPRREAPPVGGIERGTRGEHLAPAEPTASAVSAAPAGSNGSIRPPRSSRFSERAAPAEPLDRHAPARQSAPDDRDGRAALLPAASRAARFEDLPTVEPAGQAPLPPSLFPPALDGDGPSETVVRIAIGRIDVRTPPAPPAPAARPARTGPRLSLADYLERRDGRRR